MKRVALILLILSVFMFAGNIEAQVFFDESSLKQTYMNNLSSRSIAFIENRGQFDEDVLFKAETGGVTFFFNQDGAVFLFKRKIEEPAKKESEEQYGRSDQHIDLNNRVELFNIKTGLIGSNPEAKVVGADRLPHYYNYFKGNDRSQWRTNVPSYSSIIYKDIYPGIDLQYYGNDHSLKYDFIVHPRADVSNILIRYEGVEDLSVNSTKGLEARTAYGFIYEKAPYIFQEINGTRKQATGRYEIKEPGVFGFAIDDSYDIAYTLVIDPQLVYSTFLGGSSDELFFGVAADDDGKCYLAGMTGSFDFPTTPGSFDTTLGYNDIFITCLDPSREGDEQLIWSTFIGSDSTDLAYDIGLDNSGNVIVAGYTAGTDFPVTSGAYDESFNGRTDAVIAKLSDSGDNLLYSTYFGGSRDEWAAAFDIDESGAVIVGGYTHSYNMPVTPGVFQPDYRGNNDVFVMKLNLDGSGENDLVYSTFLGGSSSEGWRLSSPYDAAYFDLALNSAGQTVLVGMTRSHNFPTTAGSYDPSYNGIFDGFISCLSDDASNLIFSTFLGGADLESAGSVAVDNNDYITVAGYTYSQDFPTTEGAYDRTLNGSGYNDGFIARLSPLGDSLIYSTFIGGQQYDPVRSLILSPNGKVIIGGGSGSWDFPTTSDAYDPTYNGNADGYLCCLRFEGNSEADLVYSTYIGNSGDEFITNLAYNVSGALAITGITDSPDFPIINGFDTEYNGARDAFLGRFEFPTSIDDSPSIPEKTGLLSNYPNPFNAQTTIVFYIDEAFTVRLNIYNILGQQIETLIDSRLVAGKYRVNWNADRYVSGMYFCKLTVGDKVFTKKITLIK